MATTGIPDKYTAVYVAQQNDIGTAANASGTAANAIDVLSVAMEFTGPGNLSRSNRRTGYGGGRLPVYVGMGMRIDMTLEMLPPPTPGVVTNYQQYVLLQSIPMTITDSGSVYDLTPVSGCVQATDYYAVTVDINTADGNRYRLMDGITELKEIRGTAEGVVEWDVSVHGIYVAVADAATTAPAQVGKEIPIACIGSTFDFGWNSSPVLVSQWKFIPGMTAHTPRTQNTVDGAGQTVIVYSENARLEYTIDENNQSTDDHMAEVRGNTARTLEIDIGGDGTPNGQLTIASAASGSKLVSAVPVVEDEIRMIQCVQEMTSVAGNDQFTISIR